ncbi:hypothetical protein ACO1O0_003865 [Amphichorda felina]
MGPPGVTRRDGVACIICNPDGKVLVGKRKGSHGAGSWGLPGGHIDPGETEEVTAAREVVEETGLEVRAVGKVAQTEDDFVVPGQYAKYYNTHFIWCEVKDAAAQPEVKEPNKCYGWEWKTWEELRVLRDGSKPDEVVFQPLWKLLGLKPELSNLRPRK